MYTNIVGYKEWDKALFFFQGSKIKGFYYKVNS